jgi:hypothetical protein
MSDKNINENNQIKDYTGRRYLFLIACFVMLTGCAQYQYMFVDSHLPQNDNKEFIIENDTVMIKYTFSGENFPVTLTICNKLNQPVYIDWENSAAIINDVQINDAFSHDGQISFIAPMSYAVVSSNELQDQFIKLDLNDPNANVALIGGNARMLKYSYGEESTPLFLRIILALFTNENYSDPTYYDYSFWVSDIVNTSAGPVSLGYNPPNQFHIRKETGFGKFMGWTALITSTLILGAISGQ